MPADYQAAFNGDRLMREEVARLVTARNVKTIVECGTYLGQTTPYLATLAERVVTIECRRDFFEQGEHLNVIPNVVRVWGDSVKWLEHHGSLLSQPIVCLDPTVLYFIDSHWGADWPIQRELIAIAGHGGNPVLVIHDFQVPNTTLGFDIYRGQSLNLAYVTTGLDAIYGSGRWQSHYNDERAEGSRRGVLYVEPA